MSSHSLTAGCYLITVVAVPFLYTLVHAQYTASIEGKVIDQNGAVVPTVHITTVSRVTLRALLMD